MKHRLAILALLLGLAACQEEATAPEPPTRQSAEVEKAAREENIPELSYLKARAMAAGPDAFGYTWIDSDEPGGPTYDWVDISGVGTPVPFPFSYVDDGTVGPLPLGFDFPFYGNVFDELYVSSNGWMSFTNGALRTYTNRPLPSALADAPENLLAPWWDDMVYDESNGNTAFYYNDGSRFIVQMYVRRLGGFTPPFYQFQVILYPTGDIVFQYEGLGTNLISSTIGIQNATKDDGFTINHNDGSYPHEGLAILISARSVESVSDALTEAVAGLNADGVLNGGQTQGLTVKIAQALSLYEDGKSAPAVSILGGFIDQVNDLAADGVLTAEQAADLIAQAEVLIVLIQAEAAA